MNSARFLLPEHRRVEVATAKGVDAWNLIDRPGTDPKAPVVVCLHGNPTWSLLWSRLVTELDPRYRVIAPDHLQMGFSRAADPAVARPYAQRVRDLTGLLDALGVTEPVWLVGQDWGGAIAMGWAVAHPGRVAGLVLSNTGIAVPAGRRGPGLIRVAGLPGLGDLLTRRTPVFVAGAARLPGAGLTRDQRRALAAPYRRAADRRAVAGFVADVPWGPDHPSAAEISEVAERLAELDVPVRLIWGARDPVFDDSFAQDLLARFRDVELHRFADAGHLAVLEVSIAPIVEAALTEVRRPSAAEIGDRPPLWSAIERRAADSETAICDLAAGDQVSFAEFAGRVSAAVANLQARGVRRGDRVAMLVPPGVDLIAAVYACWRLGAITVIADRGLGLGGLGRAVRAARVAHVLGTAKALVAARTLRWAPGAQTIDVEELRSEHAAGSSSPASGDPDPEDLAAVLFTSGATGPAKGVRYTHGQLAAQRDAVAATYQITDDDAFVAAFAPFALFGPALGITTALPAMDVTAPATLTAGAVADAARAVEASMLFASPTALANVVATACGVDPRPLAALRLVMSAGAPVPLGTLQAVAALCPQAAVRTPYGMTEVLPVADVELRERERIGAGRGVCVGQPVPGAQVEICAVGDSSGAPLEVGITGEVVISADWMSEGYDRLWHTEQLARSTPVAGRAQLRWHRSGDVGHLDAEGNLWIEGRVAHLIHTPSGPVTPVPLEIAAESVALDGARVTRAAAVGVGPAGVAQVVLVVEVEVVVESSTRSRRRPRGPRLAPAELREAVRAAVVAAGAEAVAAVWIVDALPVDIRHNAKIDRVAVAQQMERLMAGQGS